ncbi:MAG: archaeosortase/exosortase family protein [Burkholderiales bacterium]|nr:archaeosortase/exosortase family protein [Burkholderiales bacterium]
MKPEQESYDQFVARVERPARPLASWLAALLFLCVFGLLELGYDVCRESSFEHWVIGDLTVAPTAALINLLSPATGVKALGNQLLAPGGGLVILKGCEGVEVMFMLVAAFAAVNLPWRRRLAGLVLGLAWVFCLNEVRLIALFYAGRHDTALFNLLHGTVLPVVLVLAVALYVLAWLPGERRRSVDAAA